jgi:hypothetical protein
MRGAAVAVMLGCAFGGIAYTAEQPHVTSDVQLAAAVQPIPQEHAVRTAKSAGSAQAARSAAAALKTVTYRGYSIQVPSSWPVYSLDQDPSRCVRYDISAVYLGTPGPNQDCPPHVIGHADTLSIGGPLTPGEPSVPIAGGVRASVGATRGGADRPAAPGTILENSHLHEFAVSMPDSAPAVSATYGGDPGYVMWLLSSLRQATAQQRRQPVQPDARAGAGAPPGPTTPGSTPPGSTPPGSTPQEPASEPSAPAWIPPSWPAPAPTPTGPAPKPAPTGSGVPTQPAASPSSSSPPVTTAGALNGFDTCTAPSLAAMKAWKARYSAIAVYIGGAEMGCSYGNLSRSWVSSTEGMGWSLMPTYVGPQAPCNSFSDEINPSQAAAEGKAEANTAVADAASFGMGKGTPIYYDMEGYNESQASCVSAVLTFLDAWDRQLEASGYVSGVYSSAASGVSDLQSARTIAGHALAEPQAIWIALWDNALNVTGSPYVSSSVWPTTARSKQYAGPKVVKIGGYSLDIDSDLVDGPVAH